MRGREGRQVVGNRHGRARKEGGRGGGGVCRNSAATLPQAPAATHPAHTVSRHKGLSSVIKFLSPKKTCSAPRQRHLSVCLPTVPVCLPMPSTVCPAARHGGVGREESVLFLGGASCLHAHVFCLKIVLSEWNGSGMKQKWKHLKCMQVDRHVIRTRKRKTKMSNGKENGMVWGKR